MTKKGNPESIVDGISGLDKRVGNLEKAINDPKNGLISRIASIETELKLHRYYIPIVITVVLFILKYVLKL